MSEPDRFPCPNCGAVLARVEIITVASVSSTDQLEMPKGVHISCVVCLNQGKRETAVTLVKDYAVCADHVELVSAPGFDIFSLRGESRAF